MNDLKQHLLNKKVVYSGSELIFVHRWLVSLILSAYTKRANNRGEQILVQNPFRINMQLKKGLSVLILIHGFPIGYLTTYDLGFDKRRRRWWEVGTGYVPRPFRGFGLGHVLYDGAAQRHKKDVLVGTTKNPVALHLSVAAGFKVESYVKVPAVIRKSLCYEAPCFVVSSACSGCCKSEHNLNGTCYARVRWPVM